MFNENQLFFKLYIIIFNVLKHEIHLFIFIIKQYLNKNVK